MFYRPRTYFFFFNISNWDWYELLKVITQPKLSVMAQGFPFMTLFWWKGEMSLHWKSGLFRCRVVLGAINTIWLLVCNYSTNDPISSVAIKIPCVHIININSLLTFNSICKTSVSDSGSDSQFPLWHFQFLLNLFILPLSTLLQWSPLFDFNRPFWILSNPSQIKNLLVNIKFVLIFVFNSFEKKKNRRQKSNSKTLYLFWNLKMFILNGRRHVVGFYNLLATE